MNRILAIAVLVAVAISGLIGYRLGTASGRVAHTETLADIAKQTARAANLATKAVEAARAKERQHAEALASIASKYEQDKLNVQANAARIVADLRAGNRRLHQRWQAAQATADLSRAVASAGQSDAEARDREESAGRAIAAADQCDAQVEGLQAVIRADRGE